MTGSYFLMSIVVGGMLGLAAYSLVGLVTKKWHVNKLRAISWSILTTLTLMLSLSVFCTIGAEKTAVNQSSACSNNSAECYAKEHYNPVRECKLAIDEKANFPHVWLENSFQNIFEKYFWLDQSKRTIQIFGHQANAINSLGIFTPLQYFCIFNANTGEIIAAAFE
ncbi:TPA: hypothetical protein ACOEAG_004767 [Enterobacter cloacae]